MYYKNGSIIGVDISSSPTGASGVWGLNAIQEGRTTNNWPAFLNYQLLDTSNLSSNSNGAWITKTYNYTSSFTVSGTTGRFVVHHYDVQTYTGDVQYDNIVIPTSTGDVTYNFEASTNASGWETTTVNVGNTFASAYTTASFVQIASSSTGNRWQRDSGGTTSSNTGNTTDGSGSSTGFYLYNETSGSHPQSSIMRGPLHTLSNTGTISWREGYWGAALANSTRKVYWVYS